MGLNLTLRYKITECIYSLFYPNPAIMNSTRDDFWNGGSWGWENGVFKNILIGTGCSKAINSTQITNIESNFSKHKAAVKQKWPKNEDFWGYLKSYGSNFEIFYILKELDKILSAYKNASKMFFQYLRYLRSDDVVKIPPQICLGSG